MRLLCAALPGGLLALAPGTNRGQGPKAVDKGLRIRIAKMAKHHHWRVQSWYGIDDLIQEGFVCYAKVRSKYPQITDDVHILNLTSVAFRNHITNLSNRKRKQADITFADLPNDDIPPETECPDAEIAQLIAEAPPLVQRVLRALQSPEGRKAWAALYRVRRNGTRETLNERLCRMIGLQAVVDIHSLVVSYLKNAVYSKNEHTREITNDHSLRSVKRGYR